MAITERKAADGKIRYRVQVGDPRTLRISKTFTSKTKALAWQKRKEVEIDDGEFAEKVASRRYTFAELVERYIANRNAQHGGVDRKTAAQIAWWNERLGKLKLAQVKPATVAALRDKLANGDNPSEKPLGPATVNRYLAALSVVMHYAAGELEWLQTNVVSRVNRSTEPQGRVRFLDRDTERTRLLDACRKAADPRLYPLVVLALATGARQGELLGLKWADVDDARGFIVLHDTKNGERRSLAISPPAREALAMLRSVRVLGSEFIFVGQYTPAGEAPTFTSSLRDSWALALREANVVNFRFHDLRHTAASYAAMSGATAPELAAFLGHKTLAMVKRYSHLSPGHMQAVADRMAAGFLADLTGAGA